MSLPKRGRTLTPWGECCRPSTGAIWAGFVALGEVGGGAPKTGANFVDPRRVRTLSARGRTLSPPRRGRGLSSPGRGPIWSPKKRGRISSPPRRGRTLSPQDGGDGAECCRPGGELCRPKAGAMGRCLSPWGHILSPQDRCELCRPGNEFCRPQSGAELCHPRAELCRPQSGRGICRPGGRPLSPRG